MEFVLPSFSGAGLLSLVGIVLLVVALLIVPRNRRPSSSLAWILLIVVLPIIGILLFLLIGSAKLPRVRRERQQHMDELIDERGKDLGDVDDESAPPWLPSVAHLNQNTGAMRLLEGNDARLLTTFDAQLGAMIATVNAARRYVHVEFYILSLDERTAPFFAALGDAAKRGVAVRVLVDHLGSRAYPGFKPGCRELDRLGVQWHLMLPVQPLRGRYQRPDLRNHRKLLVADGEVAYIGSLNVIDPSYEKPGNIRRHLAWKDLLAEVHGPIVREIEAVFVSDWYSETDELLDVDRDLPDAPRGGDLLAQIIPSGPAFSTENNLALFNALIYYAQRRLSITSPYFVPDESLLTSIVTAARRGVEVELFVGEIGDQFFVFHAQHSYYEALLDAGVRIYLYPEPSILHAKHFTVDEQVAVIGSSNMDIRSLQLNLEVMMMVCGRGFVDEMRAVEDEYRRVSRELTKDEWMRRSWGHGQIDDWTALTSAVQ